MPGKGYSVIMRLYGPLEPWFNKTWRPSCSNKNDTGQVGATVNITIEINANSATGFPENVVRTVTENCKTLRFISQGFEDA